ncbi:4Fe-4S dicluster domain-containing protein [Fuchsiella alkaliacetigena]|uniref:4Fe-4S dicluster domain-containing protein n=1 Tax=Fuchsiella alkaliacetigena TaxID=957042 RepID=UPI002009E573|nr:4Fe-4S dicluster domain-containing protein [Fuchsiella alkaliacetigena]MCK8825008.1 4Fe-4S dicluster domain-containing protein [Fuchsiella alkaliacetigena]
MLDKILNFIDKIDADPIKIDQQYCTRLQSPKSNCTSCYDFCPQEAIQMANEELSISFSRCINCGLCVNSCPNQVFTLEMNSDLNIINEFQANSNSNFKISCQEAKKGNGAHVKCLGRISVNLLLKLLLVGADSIWLQPGDCSNCELKKGRSLIEEAAENCNSLLKNYSEQPRVFLSTTKPNLNLAEFQLRLAEVQDEEEINRQGVGRREFINKVREESINSLIDLISFGDEKETEEEIEEKINPNRQELITLVEKLEKEAQVIDKTSSQSLFWQINIKQNCNFCGACVMLCPNHALDLIEKKDENNEGKRIIVENKLCSNCKLCQEVCFKEQIAIIENRDYDLKAKTAYQGKKIECIDCNKSFYAINKNKEICSFCE